MINKLQKILYLAVLAFVSLPWIVLGYQGGITKAHNHTPAAGDGGLLSNLKLGGQTEADSMNASTPTYSFKNAPKSGFYHQVFPSVAIASTSWNTSTWAINAPGYNIPAGSQVRLTTTGTLPAGLSVNTTYFVTDVDLNNFDLSDSFLHYLQGSSVTFTTQGTGTHTVAPLSVPDVGVSVSGIPVMRAMLIPGTTQAVVTIGNTLTGPQNSEVLHMEGAFDGGGGVPRASDAILVNTQGGDARLIAGANGSPAGTVKGVYAYLIGHGPNAIGNYVTSPALAQTAELRFEGNTGGTFFVNVGLNYFFITDRDGTPVTSFIVLNHGEVFYRADSDPSPAMEGHMYYNTSSHKLKYWNGSSWISL